jgi:hypothetical protein
MIMSWNPECHVKAGSVASRLTHLVHSDTTVDTIRGRQRRHRATSRQRALQGKQRFQGQDTSGASVLSH